jgi:hypothetical protein
MRPINAATPKNMYKLCRYGQWIIYDLKKGGSTYLKPTEVADRKEKTMRSVIEQVNERGQDNQE